MKKLFFLAALSLVAVFGVSATVADSNTPTSENFTSSVTVTIAGMDREFEFNTETLASIYNLMPEDIKSQCADSYSDIAPRIERSNRSFSYLGVRITPTSTANGTDLKFSYGGHSVVVRNYTKAEFDTIFGL